MLPIFYLLTHFYISISINQKLECLLTYLIVLLENSIKQSTYTSRYRRVPPKLKLVL